MARPLRIIFEGAWYHVMNRGINHAKLYFNDNHRNKFLKLLSEAKTIYGIEIHAYCLMDNHYHLIMHTPRGNISQAVQYINSHYARFINIDMKRDGPLFKGRFKAILVSENDYLLRLSRYIHRNPLEAKMNHTLSNYKWSSYCVYIGKHECPEWLTSCEIIQRFGEFDFCRLYEKFVETIPDETIEDFYNSKQQQPVLGADDFRKMIDDHVKKFSLSADIVGADRILVPPTIASIVEAIASHFGKTYNQITQATTSIKNPERRIGIYICRKLGGYSLAQIGAAFGGVSYKTIASTIHRLSNDVDQANIANSLISRLTNNSITINKAREKSNDPAENLQSEET